MSTLFNFTRCPLMGFMVASISLSLIHIFVPAALCAQEESAVSAPEAGQQEHRPLVVELIVDDGQQAQKPEGHPCVPQGALRLKFVYEKRRTLQVFWDVLLADGGGVAATSRAHATGATSRREARPSPRGSRASIPTDSGEPLLKNVDPQRDRDRILALLRTLGGGEHPTVVHIQIIIDVTDGCATERENRSILASLAGFDHLIA